MPEVKRVGRPVSGRVGREATTRFIMRPMQRTRLAQAHSARGMVATPHTLASEAGVHVLRDGGNALDAAIAAATTIAVVYPHMNGIGGDNFWLVYDAERRALLGLNAAGRSAARADLPRYAALGSSVTLGGSSATAGSSRPRSWSIRWPARWWAGRPCRPRVSPRTRRCSTRSFRW